jgi:hypothetical protein
MPEKFFKFPRTPHLWWPLERAPKDDHVLDTAAAEEFLSADVIVEEKVDGANLGISVDGHGEIRAQNRGSWLERGAPSQFHPLWAWISQKTPSLLKVLSGDRIMFGEWCFAVHSIFYDRLPDWFLGFDMYEASNGKFWSTARRDEFLRRAGLCVVPRIFTGRISLADLQRILQLEPSRLGSSPIEGLYVRRENQHWLEARAKLVRPEFLLRIEKHWSSKPLEQNRRIGRANAS